MTEQSLPHRCAAIEARLDALEAEKPVKHQRGLTDKNLAKAPKVVPMKKGTVANKMPKHIFDGDSI